MANNTIQQIRSLLGLPKTQLYAEKKLADGRVIVTEADEFTAGTDVRVISDDGSTTELTGGTYDTEDGGKIQIDNESKIQNLADTMIDEEKDKAEGLQEEAKKEDMNYEAVKAALIAELDIDEAMADKVAAIAAGIYAEKVEAEEEKEEKEEMAEESKPEEKTEMASVLAEFATQLSEIQNRLQKFEEQPAAEGVNTIPQSTTSTFDPSLDGMNRALSYFNSTKK